jgi:type IV pilus assembly protein PilM
VSRTLIGLDVGTTAVRAAELRFGRGKPSLVRFAQVALEPGVVVAGEVVDAAAVGAALKRLWRDGGFTSRRVITGVAGPRVVSRTTDLPAMSDDDLRSSLPFQVQELIPIPLDEAVIDHQVLETYLDDEGAERARVLVVAAHRDLLRSLMAALEVGGLEPERIDIIPFALIRALHANDFAELGRPDGATAEAIVDVGGGITNVVVHEHGVPGFIRSLPTGGVELTEAIVTDLDVDFGTAEALKRAAVALGASVGGGGARNGDLQAHPAHDVVNAAAAPVLEEIRTSIEFWQAQTPDKELRALVLTGGATHGVEIAGRLERLTAVPVAHGHAFDLLDTTKSGLKPEALAVADTVAAVAVGLALSGESLGTGVRRISLVPREIAVARRERRMVYAAAGAIAAFAVLLLGLYLVRAGELRRVQERAEQEEARTTELQAQVAQLHDIEALEADLADRRDTASDVLEGDVAWGRLVQEVAAVLPNDVWLTSFSGSRGTDTEPGTVTFNGMGFDQTSTARWILRVSELDSLSGLWVPSSTKTPEGEGPEVVTFSSNATLTPAAESGRARRFTGVPE